MRTPREYYPHKPIVYTCELDMCPECHEPMKIAYTSGAKTVQTMAGVLTIVQRPKYCSNLGCVRCGVVCKSAQWQQVAPCQCTYGYDVIAQIGWLRQMHYERFGAIQAALQSRLQISEAEVRHLYHERYLPLLACHERHYLERLRRASERSGLILGLDGLAPEGGEPQLWVVRELQTGLTLRSGWLSQQDQRTFVNFLQPIAELGQGVVAVISDKQRGLEPAVRAVFSHAKHALCQSHYLKNAAAPVAEADEAMKVTLRKAVRDEVGDLIRREKVEKPGVLTVTGLLPSPVDQPGEEETPSPPMPSDPVLQEQEAIVQDLLRRVLPAFAGMTLKGRPPFRLAGIEMVERLAEVKTCLDTLMGHRSDVRLVELKQGLHTALLAIHPDYTQLRQAADWLEHIRHILDPEGNPDRCGAQVRQELFAYLDDIQSESQLAPHLRRFYQKIYQTSLNYTPGLFHCYDVPGLPRTNNDRESEFRDLNRRLLATTGQKGLVKRIIQREGAWELIPRPDSLRDTVSALSQVNPDDFSQERRRICTHRSRFRLHTRSAKLSQAQLKQLAQRWQALPPLDSS
jgi:hypothetical protein